MKRRDYVMISALVLVPDGVRARDHLQAIGHDLPVGAVVSADVVEAPRASDVKLAAQASALAIERYIDCHGL